MTIVYIEDKAIWRTLNLYRQSIKFMKQKNSLKYNKAITKETKIYNDTIKELNEHSY